jgi:RNA polymerase sigma factor (sigma-70 family)
LHLRLNCLFGLHTGWLPRTSALVWGKSCSKPFGALGTITSVDLDFVELCDTYYADIARFVKRHRISPSTADDLVQRTFLEAREQGTYDPSRGTPRAWLFGIALNVIRGHFREVKATRKAFALAAARESVVYEDDIEQLVAKLDAQAQRAILDHALRSLRREHLEVLALWAWTDLTQREIAAILRRPPGTIKTHLHEARAHMVTALRLSMERTDG